MRAMVKAFCVLSLLFGAAPAISQPLLSGPVQIVVGYAPGGTGDIVVKALADDLPTLLGQPVTLSNQPGSSGILAAQFVAKAAPDGRTLLLGQTAEMAINHNLLRNVGYDPERDFQPVALLATVPLVLVVPASAPYGTVQELLRAARSNPKGLSFASSGTGTPGHLAGELLGLRGPARLTHVPFAGSGVGLDALLGGKADFYFAALPAARSYIASGQLKALAVTGSERAALLPSVPTLDESGIRGVDLALWLGVFAPARTPTEIVNRLNRDIYTVLAKPEFRERLVSEGFELRPMSVDRLRSFLREDIDRYAGIIQDQFCSRLWFGGCSGQQD